MNLPGNLAVTVETNALGRPTAVTDPSDGVVRFQYTPGTAEIAVITNPLGRMTSFRHDDRGNVTAVIYPDGTREESEFEADSNQVAATGRGGSLPGPSTTRPAR